MDTRCLDAFCFLVLCAVATCVTGCASAVGYRPMGADGFGYTSTVRDDGSVKVSFKGNRKNSVPQVRQFALCRAAELVAQRGLPLMAVVDEDGESKFAGTRESCSENYYTKQTVCSQYDVYRPVATVVVRGIAVPGDTKGEALSVSEQATACKSAQN